MCEKCLINPENLPVIESPADILEALKVGMGEWYIDWGLGLAPLEYTREGENRACAILCRAGLKKLQRKGLISTFRFSAHSEPGFFYFAKGFLPERLKGWERGF